MDECRLYELFDLIDLIPYASSVSNNQMRYIVWASLKPYLKKKNLGPEDLFKLYTDNESIYVEEEKEQELDENEIDMLRKHILEQLKTPV